MKILKFIGILVLLSIAGFIFPTVTNWVAAGIFCFGLWKLLDT